MNTSAFQCLKRNLGQKIGKLKISMRLIMSNKDVPELKSSEAGGCTLGLTGGGCLTAPPPGRPRLPSAPLPICDIRKRAEGGR